MELNSCIYECSVMHNRLEKKSIKFNYKYFMFYIDLSELSKLSKKFFFFSRNRFNLFSFRDRDHISYQKPDVDKNIRMFLKKNGIEDEVGSIKLLTNVATLGYNFNPVSFYFCFDKNNRPLCAVPEVGNTFGEFKPFFINNDELDDNIFKSIQQKNFYVSPFIEHDVYFDFNLKVPGDTFTIKIDDYKDGKRVFISSLHGKKKKLSDAALLYYFFRYPLVTIKVISMIHYQALKLALKKIRYFKKSEFLELQKGAMLKWKE